MIVLDDICRGDHVKGRRIVYDSWVEIQGVVTSVDKFQVGGVTDDALIYVVGSDGFAEWFGFGQILDHRKPEPAKLPLGGACGWCHYCGQPAYSFGFFDEPTCPECGG